MLLHCDLVFASEQCFLQMPFSRLGVCPELGSSLLLPHFMGHQRAAELLMLGDRFSAETAREYGLVNAVLPQEEYLALKRGVGIGFRWLSPIGPIRVDLASPLDHEDNVRLHITMGLDL